MSAARGQISEVDRWVIGASVIVALALIAASVIRSDAVYLPYLGGLSTLVFLYFVFGR